MPQDQVLLTILGLLVLANVLMLVSTIVRMVGRRRAQRSSMDAERARAAAAIEAFVAQIPPDAAGRARPPAPSEVRSMARDGAPHTAPALAPTEPEPTPPWVPDRREPDSAAPTTTPQAQPSDTPDWIVARLADPARWDRSVREESARVVRFGHPVTVVMAELPHLDGIAGRLGRDVVDRVIAETTRLLVTEGRAADRIAMLGDATFGILLLETAESDARGYVDRVRAVADGWLDSAGLSVRLSLGWSSPSDGDDLQAAAAIARQRMHDSSREAAGASLVFRT